MTLMWTSTSRLTPLLAVLALVLPMTAHAAEATLSRAELRGCASLILARQTADGARQAERTALKATHAHLLRQSAILEARRALVDLTKVGEVALFNDAVKRACADYAAYVVAVNALDEPGNAAANAFNDACANRDFDPGMVAGLPADLRSAWNGTAAAPAIELAALSDRP